MAFFDIMNQILFAELHLERRLVYSQHLGYLTSYLDDK